MKLYLKNAYYCGRTTEAVGKSSGRMVCLDLINRYGGMIVEHKFIWLKKFLGATADWLLASKILLNHKV